MAEMERAPHDASGVPVLLGPDGEVLPTAAAVSGGAQSRLVRAGVAAWSLIGIIALLYLVFRAVMPLAVILPPLAVALLIVYLLNPAVSALERRGARRGIGVALIYSAFVTVVAVVLSLVIPIVARQVNNLIDVLPSYVEKAVTEINQFAARRGSRFRIDLGGERVRSAIFDNRDAITSFLGGVRSVASSVLHILITVVLGIILSIYLLIDLPKIQRTLLKAVPAERRDDVVDLAEKIGRALGGFFRGQLLVAAFVGVASALGLTLIKLPFAVVIGLVAGIFNLVPLIGPFIGAIPAVLVAVLSGQPGKALAAVVVLLVVQQVDNHIISPNVMGRTVRLHPVTVMLALLAGGTIAGIFGMLIAVPGVAVLKIVAMHFWRRRDEIAAAAANAAPVPEGVVAPPA